MAPSQIKSTQWLLCSPAPRHIVCEEKGNMSSMRALVSSVCLLSVMRFTVFHQAVCDVVDLEQRVVILLLHLCVDCPGHNLHPSLGPVLHVVPGYSIEHTHTPTHTPTHTQLYSGTNNWIYVTHIVSTFLVLLCDFVRTSSLHFTEPIFHV